MTDYNIPGYISMSSKCFGDTKVQTVRYPSGNIFMIIRCRGDKCITMVSFYESGKKWDRCFVGNGTGTVIQYDESGTIVHTSEPNLDKDFAERLNYIINNG